MMLKCGVTKLKYITEIESSFFNRINKKKFNKSYIKDHLPFGNKIQEIAKSVNIIKLN